MVTGKSFGSIYLRNEDYRYLLMHSIMGKLLPSVCRRIKTVILRTELVSYVWDTTGEDYGPPVVMTTTE